MSTGRNNFNSSLERKGLSENRLERGKKVSVSGKCKSEKQRVQIGRNMVRGTRKRTWEG